MKIYIASAAAIMLSGCAAPNIAGVASPITALTGVVSDAAALDQELADEFIKQSSTLYYLSNGSETCLDNDGLTPAYSKNKQIQLQEEQILKLRLFELYELDKYAKKLAGIEAERVERAAIIDNAGTVIAAGAQVAGYFPPVVEEAKAVKVSTDAMRALAVLADQQYTNYKIMDLARKEQKKVERLIIRLKEKFSILSERTQLYVNAWRACTREKYVFIRDRMATVVRPVSVVELDASYYDFRSKYRGYLNRIPRIDPDSFDKIAAANKKMAYSDTPAEFAANAKQLAALVDQLVITYKATNSTVRQFSGS